MKWISLFENFDQVTRRFYHLTSKDQLPSLFKGIRTDMAGKWEQGPGFYVTTDLKNIEEVEGIGSRVGEAIIEIEAPLDDKHFDIDFEMNLNLDNAINYFLPFIKKRFSKSERIKNFLIFYNEKPNLKFQYLEVRDEEIGHVPISEDTDWCYIPVDKKGNLNLEYNIYGAPITKHMFEKLPKDIQNQIRSKIFKSTEPGALRYIGPITKPTRYKIKQKGVWSDWKDNFEIFDKITKRD